MLRALLQSGAPALGVFLDFSSLIQTEAEGVATSDADGPLLETGLHGLSSLFAHPYTWVAKVTTFPEDYPASYSLPIGANVAKYDVRGWPLAETAWAAMTKIGPLCLDLGLLRKEYTDFGTIFTKCRAARRPPPLPEEFGQWMLKAKFARPERDRPLVTRLYVESFATELARAATLTYAGLYWGDAEAQQVAAVMASGALDGVVSIDLSNNGIGAAGAAAIAKALSEGAAKSLKELRLSDNLGVRQQVAEDLLAAAQARNIELRL